MQKKTTKIIVKHIEELPKEHIEGYDIIVRTDPKWTIKELIKVRPF